MHMFQGTAGHRLHEQPASAVIKVLGMVKWGAGIGSSETGKAHRCSPQYNLLLNTLDMLGDLFPKRIEVQVC
jgi:hypothetical protein